METPLEDLNAQRFLSQLGTIFTTQLPDSTQLELELFEVEEPPSAPQMELFRLAFRGPRTPRLPQQIYLLRHEKLGSFGLFLTAVGMDQAGICYESIFHRFRDKKPATA
jgi:hypothetical protein